MGKEAQHTEISHHPKPGHPTETSHKDLIHHAYEAPPKAKAESKSKSAEIKHTASSKEHTSEHVKVLPDSPHSGRSEHHEAKSNNDDKKTVDKKHQETALHSGAKHPVEAKPHPDTKHSVKANGAVSSAMLKRLEAAASQEHTKIEVEHSVHPENKPQQMVEKLARAASANAPQPAERSPLPEHPRPVEPPHPIHAVITEAARAVVKPPPEVHKQTEAKPPESQHQASAYEAFTSYVASTSAFKAVENFASHPLASASSLWSGHTMGFSISNASERKFPKTKEEIQLDSIKHDTGCEGLRMRLAVAVVGKNETGTHGVTTYTADDKGHGIAIGAMQWNQERGGLVNLLKHFHTQDPSKFNTMFGAYSERLLKQSFVRNADFNHNPTLYKAVHEALADKEFQQVQHDFANFSAVDSCNISHSVGIYSYRGVFNGFDEYNQMGRTGYKREVDKIPKHLTESKKIDFIMADTEHKRAHGTERNQIINVAATNFYRTVGNLERKVAAQHRMMMADNK